ncbi:MAG TPA: NlpC/P60 family protein, partial [Polyangia bacterium]|nr:NlpC/P60 family protein [Polyangia bacterium]
FTGTVDEALAAHLDRAARDPRPDLLALAMQYVAGAPPILENGLQIAGDADYGPLSDDGQRAEGADFNDYLGVPWTYRDGTFDRPESRQLRSLDCSGFMRMIWGYRAGMPLGPVDVTDGSVIPRRVVQMSQANLGVTIITNARAALASELAKLQAGDLVFFDADPADGPGADHVGMVLGLDTGGHLRFISSRKGANGPTLGDTRGASILDGQGLYARSFDLARRW